MKTLRLLSTILTTGALTMSACAKNEDDGESSTFGDEVGDGDGDGDFGDGDGDGEATGDGDGDGDSSTSGDGDGDGDETAGFVPTDDLASASSCDPWAQDCPENEKCVAFASSGGTWDANKCVPIMGDGQPGDPCTYADAATSTDDCGADSWCWDVNTEGMGTCTPFCTGTADNPVCDGGTSCSIANNGSINICLTSCDPLLQDCPGEGQACFFDGSAFVCANATQDIPTGEPCGFINDCVGGNICLAPESFPACNGASCCGAFCDLADPGATCLPAGTECTSFYEEGMAPPGYEDVGVCVVPA